MAEDHVMAATRGSQKSAEEAAPKLLSLSLKEAQDYAVSSNRTLKNASLAVQEPSHRCCPVRTLRTRIAIISGTLQYYQ